MTNRKTSKSKRAATRIQVDDLELNSPDAGGKSASDKVNPKGGEGRTVVTYNFQAAWPKK